MNKAAAGAIGVVVLLGAGYLGATAWAGQQTEIRFREQLAQMQARLPFVKVSEQRYDKGFFASTGTTTLQFGCPAEAGKPLPSATVTSTIRHGPIAGGTLAAAVVESQLRFSGGDADAQQLAAAFGASGPLTVRTVVAFDGGSRSTLASAAARLPLGKGVEIAWQGLSGDVDASRDGRAVSYRLKSPGLTLTDPAQQASVRIGALAFQGDGRALSASGAFLLGKVQGTLDAFEIAGGPPAAPVRVVFSGLAFDSETTLDGELLGGTSSFAGAGAIGDVRLDKVEMKMTMKRLHAPTYQRLMDTLTREAYRCDGVNPTAALAGLQQKMQSDVAALLRHGPEVSLDRLAVQSGGLAGELSYAVGMEPTSEAQAAQPLPALLLAHGHARASVRLPVAWVQKLTQAGAARLQGSGAPGPASADAMLELAQAQGYVVREGDLLKSEASFAKGALTVNGKPLGVR